MTNVDENFQDEDESGYVAVIGMAGRFPGARSVDEFWRNLLQGKETIERAEAVEAGYVPAYGVLNGADEFDAEFFGYTAEEALIIDPQQRLLLECAHEALERAGHGGPQRPMTGIFVGGASTDHATRLRHKSVAESQIRLGNDLDYLGSRVAYKLGLTGPAMSVLTACSSSLVAVHVAIQSLLAGDCAMALAGGTSVLAGMPVLRHDPGGIFSRDGHCRPFDAAGDGTVGASAVGLVVLRPLADARAEGDHIHAVIRGTAVNNDGRNKIGFAAPSVAGQAEAVRAAHLVAGTSADEIGYVETHGTATALGDPIEVAALTQAFQASTGRTAYCRIGSVKSNIGHADAAAGVAGLIKTVLSVEHGVLPATLHYTQPNPEIDFGSSPFEVNTHTQPWATAGRPRIAGVNAIGIGGTNAHAVIAQAPPPSPTTPGQPHQLLVLSARTDDALERAVWQLAEHLADHPDTDLADVAWTLQTGRTHHAKRRFFVASDTAEAVAALRGDGPGQTYPSSAIETGELWVSGAEVDFEALHTGGRRRRTSLPTYPFERQRYFVAASALS
ncbi:acyl transferase domain-containing protein [Kibdelosporangium banguiense]|uniref:Acyl transferase domain-containing protein n=1 Tax=Kibdelosporangium banguiense TaxID=1365924 RepID=A0ABS4U2U0_9PSEU|nr:type I polyketide synthase [Kibdelosporangium banguiense]MBP2330533.1 acyl transferase domain-containing protein [Kibdelosporangium banguiense]